MNGGRNSNPSSSLHPQDTRPNRLDSYRCDCLDGGHDTGSGVCMCGGRISSPDGVRMRSWSPPRPTVQKMRFRINFTEGRTSFIQVTATSINDGLRKATQDALDTVDEEVCGIEFWEVL